MPPFSGLKQKKRKRTDTQEENTTPPAAEPSPPPASSSRRKDPQRTTHTRGRGEREEQDAPANKCLHQKGLPSRDNDEDDDGEDNTTSEPEAPPPLPKPKQISYNRNVIESYRALDHKALESTRIKLGFQMHHLAALYLPRLVCAYADYDNILMTGLVNEFAHQNRFVKAGLDATHEEELETMMYNSYWETYVCYPIIRDFFPGFKDHTAYLHRKPDLVRQMATFMHCVSGKSRSNDAGCLKKVILKFHPSFTPKLREDLFNPKSRRGFQHTSTGRLLCPIRLLTQFDEDPEGFCREVRECRLKIHSTDWPLLLFDYELYLEGFDPDDPDEFLAGFMRSLLLLDAYRIVFTGESTTSIANQNPSRRVKGKAPVSSAYGIREVTTHSLCYVAALTEWEDNDGHFYGRQFVDALLTIFMRKEEFTNDLLAWWNEQIFGEPTSDLEDVLETDTAYALMLARDEQKKKAAKAAAKAAQAAPTDA